MGLFADFKTNTDFEVNGVEVEFSMNADGTIPTFIISRMGKSNKAYTKALEAASRPYRRQIEAGSMNNDVAEKMMMDVFVDTVLKGWKNVQYENGTPIEFSKVQAKLLFSELPDLYNELVERASKLSTFRTESLEEEAKN